jgi:hypothetical protein
MNDERAIETNPSNILAIGEILLGLRKLETRETFSIFTIVCLEV